MEQPAYYAVLPARIRYDTELTSFAKLMYAEITALSNREGYCWATNKYFEDLYSVSDTTVTTAIKALESRGYLQTEVRAAEGNKRYIHPVDNFIPRQKNLATSPRKFGQGSQKILETRQVSNGSGNNTREYSKIIGSSFSQKVDKYHEGGSNPLFREWCTTKRDIPFKEWVKQYE